MKFSLGEYRVAREKVLRIPQIENLKILCFTIGTPNKSIMIWEIFPLNVGNSSIHEILQFKNPL